MSLTLYLLDMMALLAAINAAFFIRINLPFGEVLLSTPIIEIQTYILFWLAWALIANCHRMVTAKANNRIIRGGVFAISILLISVFEYLVIMAVHPSMSRFFLLIFPVMNALFLAVSRLIFAGIINHKDSIRSIKERSLILYRKVNEFLNRSFAEIILAAVAGLVWAIHTLKMGLTLTTDSILYLTTALRLSTNGELIQSPHWPPLYPILIAATKVFTEFPADGAAIISASSMFIFLIIFSLLLRGYCKNAFLNLILILAMATLSSFFSIFEQAWSEQVYAVLLIANFYFLIKHQTDSKWWYFAAACLLAGLGMVTRYIGISMGILLMAYAILFAEPKKDFAYQIKKYYLPALVSFFPLLALIYWNSSTQGTGIGYSIELDSILDTMTATITVLWEDLGYPYFIILILLIILPLFFHTNLNKQAQTLARMNSFFLIGHFALTVAALIVTSPVPKSRYFAPLFFLGFLAISFLFDFFSSKLTPKWQSATLVRPIVIIFSAFLLFWGVANQLMGVENVLVDRVNSARRSNQFQRLRGFDLSLTSERFRQFFDDISSSHQNNIIVVVDGDYDMRTMVFDGDFTLPKVFLLKGSIIQGPAISGVNFFDLQDDAQNIRYLYSGQLKTLTQLIATRRTLPGLIPILIQSLEENEDAPGVFFIFNKQWFDMFAYETFQNDLIKLRFRENTDPYLIYELAIP